MYSCRYSGRSRLYIRTDGGRNFASLYYCIPQILNHVLWRINDSLTAGINYEYHTNRIRIRCLRYHDASGVLNNPVRMDFTVLTSFRSGAKP